MAIQTPNTFTAEKQAIFFATLSETCHVGESAAAAGVDRQTIYYHRNKFPEFAEAFEEARARGAEALEDELMRRAKAGVTESVFHKGEEVATVQRYSDVLGIFLMKGAMPDKYKDRSEKNITGNLSVTLKMNLADDE